MNAHKLAVRYPDSALSIGLNIAEGGAHRSWAEDGLANIAVGA
jgi:hypothetical protein